MREPYQRLHSQQFSGQEREIVPFRGESVLISEYELDEAALRAAIEKTGYRVLSVQTESYTKKGLFGRFGG